MNRHFLANTLAFVACLWLSLGLSIGQAFASPSGVVISQVYGGGGNSGASHRNDFIELFNAGSAPVSLAGWSVQYAAATGASWAVTNLSGTLQPGQYYLVQQGGNGAVGTVLPTPDATGTIAMSGSNGKVALMRTTVALTVSGPLGVVDLEDFVGYGSANGFEGTGPTGVLGNATAAMRRIGGCVDAGNNAADFEVLTPTPRNTATPAVPCGSNLPIIASCSSFNTIVGIAGSSQVSATDFDSIVNLASITSAAIPGITLSATTPASADGGTATARIQVAGTVTPGAYPLTVTFFNNESQSTPCSINVTVIAPPAAVTPIYTIQGSGATSPLAGSLVTTRGVVTATFPGLRGYFIQDMTGDGNPLTSDGIFVFNNAQPIAVTAGELVQVTGTVAEFAGFAGNPTVTQITNPTTVAKLGTGPLTPTVITFPESVEGDLERYEGMLVLITTPMTVSQNFFLGRYGQLTLSAGGRMIKPTNLFRPGTPQADALADANRRSRLILDDGQSSESQFSGVENPNPIPYIGAQNTVRAGDVVTGLIGIIDFGRNTSSTGGAAIVDYRLHPIAPPTIARVNARPLLAPAVGGTTRVASFNVLNYFTTFGDGQTASGQTGQGCTQGGLSSAANCRGADNLAEFNRQRVKIINAIVALDADIVGLMEIQNNGNVAAQNLVDGLNAATSAGRYAVISDPVSGVGDDAIKVALIHQPGRVTPVGGALSDTDPIHNRPPVAQTFQMVANGARFSVVVNHFKSKGCDGATGADLDQGDGQGCFNDRRRQQATRLLSFVSTVQQAAGDNDVLVIGDLNAYGREDPIEVLTSTGALIDQVPRFSPGPAYSYVFDGEAGYLDHALATPSLSAQITGTVHWPINADEPSVIDYNTEFKPQDLYTASLYRASDHDPVLIGLSLTVTLQTQTIAFAPLVDRPLGSATFVVTASATSGLAVSFSSLTPAACSVTGSTVNLNSTGLCTIAADQAGNLVFAAAARVSQSFTVLPPVLQPQTIDFAPLPGRTLGESPFTVSASASSGLPVSFSSTSGAVCTVLGTQVTLLATGQCIVRADQPGNAGFSPAPQVLRSFAVGPSVVVSDAGSDGDVPLPLWAYLVLASGLLWTGLRRARRG